LIFSHELANFGSFNGAKLIYLIPNLQ